MAAQPDIVTIIDMEDDSDTDTDTVIDFVGERVAHTVIDMGDDDDDDDMDTQADTNTAQDSEDEDDRGGGMEVEELRAPEDQPFWRQVARDLWDHLLDLLENITAHGFNHLVRGEHNNTYVVVMWACAIFVAFFSSGYYIISSVHEAEQAPVATTSNRILVQVTIFSKQKCE